MIPIVVVVILTTIDLCCPFCFCSDFQTPKIELDALQKQVKTVVALKCCGSDMIQEVRAIDRQGEIRERKDKGCNNIQLLCKTCVLAITLP